MPEETTPMPTNKGGSNVNQWLRNMSKKQLFYTALIAIIIGASLLAFVLYKVGYDKGKNDATTTINTTDTSVPNKSLTSLPASGTVESVNGGSIRIKLLGDITREATITKETKVSTKNGDAKVSDISTASKVILFTKKDGNKSIATRIVIQ